MSAIDFQNGLAPGDVAIVIEVGPLSNPSPCFQNHFDPFDERNIRPREQSHRLAPMMPIGLREGLREQRRVTPRDIRIEQLKGRI